MGTYRYKAMSFEGKNVHGTIEAPDEFLAMEQLRASYQTIIHIKPQEKKSILSMNIGTPKIDYKDLSVICSQFSIILKSGVSIDTCMSLIGRQTRDKNLKSMLEKSAEDVSKGNGIAASFKKNCPYLPVTFIETIRAGEESGTLEHSFDTLHRYFDNSSKTKQKVKQALSYPIFVFVVAIVVLFIVMIWVVPTMAESFLVLDGELPMLTKVMIGMSNFMAKYIVNILSIIIGSILLMKAYCKTENGKLRWSQYKLRIPVFGNIALLNDASRFANTMSSLLSSGLGVNQALEITGKVLDSYAIGLEVFNMVEEIEEGRPLGECMRKSKYFPDTLIEMCSIGETTGELEPTLETIGSYYDNEAQYATSKAIQKLEPTIMIIMALFAAFIVIAIYLPMFNMYDLM